jgi:PIN domain nuclease of toxin-antitoxin system
LGSIKGLKLLLDTHIILWSVADPEKLLPRVAKELDSDDNELWFSPISVWEIMLLAEKGQVDLGSDIERSVRDIFKKIPLTEAPLNIEVAIQSRLIKLPHQDPADLFLAATSRVYDLKLVTADARLLAAEGIPLFN